jgi:hypothetical protein
LEQQFGAALHAQLKDAWIMLYGTVQSDMMHAGLRGT